MMPGQRCPLCEAGRKAEGDIGTVMRSISGADETGGKPLRHGSRRRRWEDQKLQGDGGRGPGGARSTESQSGTRRRGKACGGFGGSEGRSGGMECSGPDQASHQAWSDRKRW